MYAFESMTIFSLLHYIYLAKASPAFLFVCFFVELQIEILSV